MSVSTGVPGLDGLLGGGIPANRVVLLTGEPGTGKSTLGMQYLQAGLREDEECLYVSTEQTADELFDTFAGYEFDLEHRQLSVATLNAVPGTTIDAADETLVIDTPDGSGLGFGEVAAPFDGQNVKRFIEQYGPCDRVVLDSVSGLSSMIDDEGVTRRMVQSLIRLFTDRFGATSLFIGESPGAVEPLADRTANALRYSAHGIIELTTENVDGDYHRFLRVAKMRGADHVQRPKKLQFGSNGVSLAPHRRTRPTDFERRDLLPTGLPGLDQLCGGLVEGSTTLLQHDGRADVDPLVMSIIAEALGRGESIVLFPSANMDARRFDAMRPGNVDPAAELLDDDRLFVLDFVGIWSASHPNVFALADQTGVRGLLSTWIRPLYHRRIMRATHRINDARGMGPTQSVLYTESLLQHLSPSEIRQMYYWATENLLRSDDRVLFVQNPGVMDPQLAEFYAYDAEQILRTWLRDGGLQFVKLEKSPTGKLGATRLVTPIDTAPYMAIESVDGVE